MVSQSSICGSDGGPIDHDGNPLEDRSLDNVVLPFAVPNTVMRELLGANPAFNGDVQQAESNPFFEAAPLNGPDVAIRDEAGESDGTLSPSAAANAAHTSTIFRAAMQINSNERESAISAFKKVNDLHSFLLDMGFTMDDVNKHINSKNSTHGVASSSFTRDDMGLPVLRNSGTGDVHTNTEGVRYNAPSKSLVNRTANPVTSLENTLVVGTSLEGVCLNASSKEGAPVGDGLNVCASPATMTNTEQKSWSDVIKKSIPPPAKIHLEYYPPPEGSAIVSPPDDILRKGLDKFKHCMVGTFTKGTLSFKVVSDFAQDLWGRLGLVSISHKDARTFIFKFDSDISLNTVLSRGTWYISKRPMIVSAWGSSSKSSTIPLWIKLLNIPECYWTEEGLSFLASAIGKPLCTDPLTAELNMLPFAKICVEYKAGMALPEEISAVMLDEHGNKDTTIIQVEYPTRPLACEGCKSIGHRLGSCPLSKRVWVKKDSSIAPVAAHAPVVESTVVQPSVVHTTTLNEYNGNQIIAGEGEWTMVHKKSKEKVTGGTFDSGAGSCTSMPSDYSPSPILGFKNLRQVDEIDKLNKANNVTKSARNRMRKARKVVPGSTSTP